MAPRVPSDRNAVQYQLDELWNRWTDPEEREAEHLVDHLLGHDVERLAAYVGMSGPGGRRFLNRQRESEHRDANWLRKLIRLIVAVRRIGGGEERFLPIVRALAAAAGVDVALRPTEKAAAAPPITVVNNLVASVLSEVAEAAQITLAAVTSGGKITVAELPAIDQAIDEAVGVLHQAKATARQQALEAEARR